MRLVRVSPFCSMAAAEDIGAVCRGWRIERTGGVRRMIEGDCTDVEREERNGSGLGAAKDVDGSCRWVMRAAGRRRLRGEFLTAKVKGRPTSIQRIRAGQRQATTTTARRGCGHAAVQLGCLQYSCDLFLNPQASLGVQSLVKSLRAERIFKMTYPAKLLYNNYIINSKTLKNI